MYTPAQFRVEDPAVLHAFMRQHSFAIVVTHDGQELHATHMPVLLRVHEGPHGTLVSHMARANPQWRHFIADREIMVVFQGPHAYISPSWYGPGPAVPTWNYTAVHAYGVPRIVEDHARFAAMLQELIDYYETPRANRWSGEMPEDHRDKLMNGIVGVEIEITRLEGKFKLSQNRSDEDFNRVTNALAESLDQTEREVAGMMQQIDRSVK